MSNNRPPTLQEWLNKLAKPQAIDNRELELKYYKLIANGTIVKEPSIVLAAQTMVVVLEHINSKKFQSDDNSN